MNNMIRAMTKEDKPAIMEMMRVFYASPAVLTNGSDEIFSNDIDNCTNGNPYLEGYVIENSEEIQGYAFAATLVSEFYLPKKLQVFDGSVLAGCVIGVI